MPCQLQDKFPVGLTCWPAGIPMAMPPSAHWSVRGWVWMAFCQKQQSRSQHFAGIEIREVAMVRSALNSSITTLWFLWSLVAWSPDCVSAYWENASTLRSKEYSTAKRIQTPGWNISLGQRSFKVLHWHWRWNLTSLMWCDCLLPAVQIRNQRTPWLLGDLGFGGTGLQSVAPWLEATSQWCDY